MPRSLPVARPDAVARDPSATPQANTGDLRRPAPDGWHVEARFLRIIASLAVAGNVLAWLVDWSVHGATGLAFGLLGVRVIGALSVVPLLVGAFAARQPEWLDRSKLVAVGVTMGTLMASLALTPTTLAEQGWIMFVAFSLVGLTVRAPLRSHLAIHAVTFALFAGIVWRGIGSRGAAYGTPSELAAVLLGTALTAIAFPFVPHTMEQQRLREREVRRLLEQEIELRERRERELLQREREILDEKQRADRAAEEARKAAVKAAGEARIRTELFANMSHDLRTPMAGILGLVELLGGTSLDAEQAGYIETIRASNQTLLSLLDDVIDFARLEEGKLPLAPVSAPLFETLMRPAELMRVTAERKDLELAVELPSSLPSHVSIDPARVQQILLNLLGNALKFTQQGKVTLRAAVRVLGDGGRRLRVEVEDTGIGFTAAQKERLFRRFTQAEDGIVHKFGGSGLGLSICRSLVDLMGGELGAEGAPGRGALFWFEIPTEETRAPSTTDPGTTVPSLRVLLAEDNPVNQLVISMMLKKLGQEVVVAGDGEQALRLLMQERFHLAIMDMQMPEMDGMEVTRRLRGASARAGLTYVVALTASATAEEKERFLRSGVDAVYTKPIDMDRLRRMLIKEGAAAESRLGSLFGKRRAAQVAGAGG